jgi:hypothetical protein
MKLEAVHGHPMPSAHGPSLAKTNGPYMCNYGDSLTIWLTHMHTVSTETTENSHDQGQMFTIDMFYFTGRDNEKCKVSNKQIYWRYGLPKKVP